MCSRKSAQPRKTRKPVRVAHPLPTEKSPSRRKLQRRQPLQPDVAAEVSAEGKVAEELPLHTKKEGHFVPLFFILYHP